MCKYCSRKPVFGHNNYFNECRNEDSIAFDDYTTLDIGVDRKGNLILIAYGNGRAVYYPKYCPECGRKLQ